jgi:hypothetical protein
MSAVDWPRGFVARDLEETSAEPELDSQLVATMGDPTGKAQAVDLGLFR